MNSASAAKRKTAHVIVGPTAVGKTAAAIQLAIQLETEILSADSRQCYKELNIGVARPSPEELSKAKHHFIASFSIYDEVNAGVFETYGLQQLDNIFSSNDNAVVVGGTGLYIKALCEGIDALPQINKSIRASIIQDYTQHGLTWLQTQVKQKDPLFFDSGEIQNPQRLMRALEVMLSTGKSILKFQTGTRVERPFIIRKYGLDLPREELYARINNRVDQMMESGLLQEAESIYNCYVLPSAGLPIISPALNTVGYAELFNYFRGLHSLSVAIEQIKQHTRNYAKRQLTWFRKDPAIEWMDPSAFTRRVEIFMV